MADRVHPNYDDGEQEVDKKQQQRPPSSESNDVAISFPSASKSEEADKCSSEPLLPAPPGNTFVVVVPKDQILRYPTPRQLSKKQCASRRNRCCCCFWWLLSLIILLIVLAAIAVGVFFLVYRPKAPSYSVDKLSIQGFNLTAASSTTNPRMDVTIRANNPNNKLGIYYTRGSYIGVGHSDTQLCTGVLPEFYQPSKNVTVFQTILRGSDMMLSRADYNALRDQQRKRQIPLSLDLNLPVKIKVGSIKTWTITVTVRCDIIVDNLVRAASIISNKCAVDVKPWK